MFKSIGMYYPEYRSLSEKLNLRSLEEAPIWKQFGISQYQNILLQGHFQIGRMVLFGIYHILNEALHLHSSQIRVNVLFQLSERCKNV